jgi:dTDP-4-dehydrorhamnose 3,5-epimerase
VIFEPTGIEGALVIRLEPREDARGSFSRAFCKREMASVGLDFDIAQANLVRTHHPGVVRGLHFQLEPAPERKIVRCLRGAVFDAIVDMRPDSATFRKVHTMRLDEVNRLALFIPGGVAHGYQTLVPDTDFFYLTDQFYVAGQEKGVRYCDPSLGIPWPLPARDVAARDNEWPLL